jgi:hypothetical protein
MHHVQEGNCIPILYSGGVHITQESELTTDKLVENFDVTASPCRAKYSRYDTIQSTLFDAYILHTFGLSCAFAPP